MCHDPFSGQLHCAPPGRGVGKAVGGGVAAGEAPRVLQRVEGPVRQVEVAVLPGKITMLSRLFEDYEVAQVG